MKKKGLTYVLILVVAIVWYNVFFRVISNFNADDTPVVQPNTTNPVFSSIERDTFQLNTNFRDPFKGVAVAETPSFLSPFPTIDPQIQQQAPPKKTKREKIDTWPKIEYKGLLRKTSSTNPLAIINIDGIQLYMRKGEFAFDNIILKTIHRDSVVVFYQKEKRTFWRD
jgi:hypothetical protein